ncbi:MAG: carboxylesterase [Planctomycetes bacterium]|nr:carboxylesterase [Planctomycetota bacterium]
MNAPATAVPVVEIEPQAPVRSAVIFLHGLGSDGRELAAMVPAMLVPVERRIRWVLPSAPERSLGIAGGERRTAWFDVGPEDLWRAETSDPAGLARADVQLRALIERELARGVPSNRLVVGGFSQGGALAAYTALRYEKPLAGVFALSTFLARNVHLEAESVAANRGLPAFVAHGTEDRLVPPARGRELAERLAALGATVTQREWRMGHEIAVEELAALGAWIATRLA